jgi:hypothetical protein
VGRTLEFVAVDDNNVYLGDLPDRIRGFVNLELSDTGNVEMEYPDRGKNANLLVHGREIVTLLDGVELDNGRWIVEDDQHDGANEADSISTTKWTGRSLAGMLEKVIVYPMNWPNPVPNTHSFTSASPGTIIKTLLTRARARNAKFANIILDQTFTQVTDSAGTAWPTGFGIDYPAGQTNLLLVLQDLKNRGACDWFMRGRQLILTTPGAYARDWTLSHWVNTWWVRTPFTFDADPTLVSPYLIETSNTVDFTNKVLNGTSDYLRINSEGNIYLPESATYTFRVRYRGGARLYVNGRRIIDDWIPDPSQRDTIGSIALQPGYHKVLLESFSSTGGQRVELTLLGGQEGTLYPGTDVFPGGGDPIYPTSANYELVLPAPGGILVRRAFEMLDGPVSRTSREKVNAVLVAGDEGTFAEAASDPQYDIDGRLEGYISQGGAKDNGTLTAVGTASLQTSKLQRRAISSKIQCPDGAPLPGVAYIPGDYIWIDFQNQAERARVLQINLAYEGAQLTPSLALNDKIEDMDVLVKRRLAYIGDGLTGTGRPVTDRPDGIQDSLPPNPPTNVQMTTKSYQSASIGTQAQVTLTWTPPSLNVDNSILSDLGGYEIEYRLFVKLAGAVSASWTDWLSGGPRDAGSALAGISPLSTTTPIELRVRALDTSNNRSSWASVSGTTAADETPPNQPSALTARFTLAVVMLLWDGKDSLGLPPPDDFLEHRFYTATNPTAVWPAGWSILGSSPSSAEFPHAPSDYTPRYYRGAMVDRSFNVSTPSIVVGPFTKTKVISDDIIDGAVKEAQVAAGAISAAKTAIAAIDPTTGNLTANSVTANNVVAGSITGLQLAAGSITTPHLTVDASSDNLVYNGTFEEPPAQLGGPPPGWTIQTIYGLEGTQLIKDYNLSASRYDVPLPEMHHRSTPDHNLNRDMGIEGTPGALTGRVGDYAAANYLRPIHEDWEDTTANINANTWGTRISRTAIADNTIMGSQAVRTVVLAGSGQAEWGMAPTVGGATANEFTFKSGNHFFQLFVRTTSNVAQRIEVRFKPADNVVDGSTTVLLNNIDIPAGSANVWKQYTMAAGWNKVDTQGHIYFAYFTTTAGFTVDYDRITLQRGDFADIAPPDGNASIVRSYLFRFLSSGASGGLRKESFYGNNVVPNSNWNVHSGGMDIRFSCYVRTSRATTYRVAVEWYAISTVVQTDFLDVAFTPDTWTRVSVPTKVPMNANTVLLRVYRPTATSVAGEEVRVTGFNVVQTAQYVQYLNSSGVFIIADVPEPPESPDNAVSSIESVITHGGGQALKAVIPPEFFLNLVSTPFSVSNDSFGVETWSREPNPPTIFPTKTNIFVETAPSAAGPWTRPSAAISSGTIGTSQYSKLEGQAAFGSTVKWARLVYEIAPQVNVLTTRTVYIDDLTVKQAGGSAFIRDASIVDAKIVNLIVSKITSGTISSDWVLAGNIMTRLSGSRVWINSSGILLYDSSNRVTASMDAASGAFSAVGTLQSGFSGQSRIVVSGSAGDIKFYPTGGDTRAARIYAYVPGNYPNDVAVELRSIDPETTNLYARVYVLPDQAAMSVTPANNASISLSTIRLEEGAMWMQTNRTDGLPLTRVYIDQIQSRIEQFEPSADYVRIGGYLWCNREYLWWGVYRGFGAIDSYMELDNNGFYYSKAPISRANNMGGAFTWYVGNFAFGTTNNGGVSIGYGASRVQPAACFGNPLGGGAQNSAMCSASTGTGFTLLQAIAGQFVMFYLSIGHTP